METQASVMTIQRVSDETPQLKLFTLTAEPAWTFIPGQVCVLGVEEVGESYFAIASAPEDKGILEFLVKDGAGAAGAIFRLRQGDTLQVKGPMGKGFRIDDYKGRDLVITAVGSAVAPMRGVIRSITRRRADFGKVTAIFGVRVPTDFPFTGELDSWNEAGITTMLTLSRPEGSTWSGKSGYVTLHCGEALEGLEKPVALVCGMKEMMDESRDEFCRLGVAEDEVLTNY